MDVDSCGVGGLVGGEGGTGLPPSEFDVGGGSPSVDEGVFDC